MTPDQPRHRTPDGQPEESQPAWRGDFPIDCSQEHSIARRDFTRFLVLTSLALTVGQAWIGVESMVFGSKKPPEVAVARVDQVPVGGARFFTYPTPDQPCLLVRPAENRFLAYSQKCTHLSCSVIPEVTQRRFFCPCHNGVFDMETGRPLAGPPRRALPRVSLEIRGQEIYATGWESSA